MGHPLALCHYTMIDVDPADLVTLASRIGFAGVSLMLHSPAVAGGALYPLHGDTALRREVKRRLDDTGIILVDASSCRLESDSDVEAFRPMVESAAYLGARQINASGNDPDGNRLAEHFAALCAMAAEHGLRTGLEFQARTRVRSLPDALALIARSGATNAAVTVDSLHLARSGGTVADVAGLDPSQIAYVQLCDGPAILDPERYGWESGTERMLPGHGAFPLRALVEALPSEVTIGAEVPSQSRRDAGVSAEAYASAVLDSLMAVVGVDGAA
jgi:sugar phosphate isomerase/epimerase